MKKILTDSVELLKDGLWPKTCLVCGTGNHLDKWSVCYRCWTLLDNARQREAPSYINTLHIAFSYNETMRALIHQFKFNGLTNLAIPLVDRWAERLVGSANKLDGALILPAPDHKARRRERGYNPAELLASELSDRLGGICRPDLGLKLRSTIHQSVLSDEERKKTLDGVFWVDSNNNADTLVLIDDVIHSGRTLSRIAKAAKAAGWRDIHAIVLTA